MAFRKKRISIVPRASVFPIFQEQPRTSYRQLWKRHDHNTSHRLMMTVVETPNLQLISSNARIHRATGNIVLSSAACNAPNIFPGYKKVRYTLDNFRSEPFSPFIPDLILYGINEIESECHLKKDWSVYYDCEKTADKNLCYKILKTYIANPTATESIKQCLDNCDVNNIALCILNFFTIFEKKPLHFHSVNLKKVLSEPLYDSFLRPNLQIREIVQACVLKGSRTEVDTLAFTMMHILHLWEYTNLPLKTKVKLSKIFGPRLISFEDPVYLYKTEDVTSPQASMLEAILEICDSAFWENLNYTKRHELFIMQTDFERLRKNKFAQARERPPEFAFMCSPYSLFPAMSNTLRKYSMEEYKNSAFYKKLVRVMK